MMRRMRRWLGVWTAVGVVCLAGVARAPAQTVVVQVRVFAGGPVFFAASGFSPVPLIVFGAGTLAPVIIRPVVIVQPTVVIAPVRVVVLSPIAPFVGPPFSIVPAVLPPAIDPPAHLPPIDEESLSNVLRAPDLFDRHLISTVGTVAGVRRFVDTGGGIGTMLSLGDGWRSMMVLARGPVDVRPGASVRVTGVFFPSGSMSSQPMANVMAALAVTGP